MTSLLPLIMRMEEADGNLVYINDHKRRRIASHVEKSAWIERKSGVASVEEQLYNVPAGTHTVHIIGDVCKDYCKTLWLFPPTVLNATFEEVYDIKAAIQALPPGLESLDITSTFIVDFEDILHRFKLLRVLCIQSPSFEVDRLPASVRVLKVDVYDMNIGGGNRQNCDLSETKLEELHIARQSDFGCAGVLVLPSTLVLLRLNDNFNSDIAGVTDALKTVVVQEEYLFMDVFAPETVRMYL
jgi:hypothetical protein